MIDPIGVILYEFCSHTPGQPTSLAMSLIEFIREQIHRYADYDISSCLELGLSN
jgi:hypothetical protein